MATPHHTPTEGDRRRQAFWERAGHDLRQPVQSLQLLAQVFARHADSPQMREGVEHMRRVVDDVARMHEALVRLARLECGDATPGHWPVSLRDLASDIVSELAAAARGRNAELRASGLDLPAEADAAWLGVILRNLILFALRHCEGGEVAITGRARKGALSISIAFRAPDVPVAETDSIFLEATGPEQRQVVLGPGYLACLCALLGYRLNLHAGKPGKPEFRLTIPRSAGAA